MIKINLAKRRQMLLAAEARGTQTGISKVLGGRLNVDAEFIKTLPIRKFLILAVFVFLTSQVGDMLKEEQTKRADAALNKVTNQQNSLKAELAKTKGFEELRKAIEADKFTLKSKIETIQTLITDRQVPPKLLLSLSGAIPQEVWLSDFRLKGSEVGMRGTSLSYNGISDFMKALNESAYFSGVTLRSSQQIGDESGASLETFELSASKK